MDLNKYVGKTVTIVSSESNPLRFGFCETLIYGVDARYGIHVGQNSYFFFLAEDVKEFVEMADSLHIII